MSDKIRFAIIGTSGIAVSHINALKNCVKAEGRYIFSRDFNRAKEFAGRFDLSPARSYEEVLNDSTIDAVSIITEPHRHANLALEAIKHDKHVLIEKPLDVNVSLAKQVVEESKKRSVVSSVVSQNRFDPVIRKMKKKLSEGAIGKPYMAEVKVFWRRTEEYYNQGNGWRGKYGNVLINQAIHFIDLAVWFFGLPINVHSFITKVNEEIACYDTALVTLKFPDDMLFVLTCSTACHESEPVQFNIFGTKGKLDYNLEKQLSIKEVSKKQSVSSFINKVIKRSIVSGERSLLWYQMNDFVNAIVNNRIPAVTVRDAFEVLKIIDICEKNCN